MLFAHKRRCSSRQRRRYAIAKRYSMISTGLIPLFNNTFVDTKVTPQMEMIRKADTWYNVLEPDFICCINICLK